MDSHPQPPTGPMADLPPVVTAGPAGDEDDLAVELGHENSVASG